MSVSAPRIRLMARALDGIPSEDVTLALSMRSLTSTYKGPCVQVRRDPAENSLVFVSKVDGSLNDRLDSVVVSATGDTYVVGRQRAATFYDAQGTSVIVGADYGYVTPCIAKYQNGTPVWLAGIDGFNPVETKPLLCIGEDENVFSHGTINKSTTSLSVVSSSGATSSLPWHALTLYGAPLVKFSASGDVLWSTSTRSPGYNVYGRCIAPDQASGVYVGGSCYVNNSETVSTVTFYDSTGAAAATLDASGTYGVGWLGRYNASGHLLWTSSITGPMNDGRNFRALVPDQAGGVLAAGGFSTSANVMHSNGAPFATLTGGGAFISQYDAAGTALTAFRAAVDSTVTNVLLASDGTSNGNIYLSGTSSGRNIYHSNNALAGQLVAPTGTGYAAFLVKYDSMTLKALWWTSVDGAQTETSTGLAADANGVYMTGSYGTTAGGTANIYHANAAVAGVLPSVANGGGFFIKYSPTGNVTSWSSTSSGSIEGVAIDYIRNRAMFVGYSSDSSTANILNQSSTVLSSVTGTGEAGFLGAFQLGSTLQDIGFKNGSLDISALQTHCPPGSNGYVQTWYSQSPSLEEYPPAPMTANTTTLSGQAYGDGTYVARSSSFYTPEPQSIAYAAFDYNAVTYSSSALQTYTTASPGLPTATSGTTNIDGVDVRGEWIELKLPAPQVVKQHAIMPRFGYPSNAGKAARDFTIAGSHDGTNFVALQSWVDQQNAWTNLTLTIFNIVPAPLAAYQYYRLVITKVKGPETNPCINISEWRLYSSDPPLVEEYPPAPMTTDTTTLSGQAYGNGTYVATASSVHSSTYHPWKAFDRNPISDNTNPSFWHSTAVAGVEEYSAGVALNTTETTVDGVGVLGAWLEFKLPLPIILSGYGIMPRAEFLTRTPMDFVIAGSRDGVVWTQVDTRTSQTGYTANTLKQFTVTPSTPYQYYRIIVSRLVATNQVTLQIGEWRLYSKYSDRNARQFLTENQPLLIQNGVIKTTNRPLIDFSGGKSLVVGYDATAAGTPLYTANLLGVGQSTYTTTISSGEVIGVRSDTPTITENQQFTYGTTPNTLSSARATIGSVPILDTLSQHAQTSCLAAFSFRRLFGKYKGPVVRLRKTFEYPPLALTANTTVISGQPYGNGTYIASGSNEATNVYLAFNRSGQVYPSGGGYVSSAYTGTTTTTVSGVDVLGEWIQLAMSSSIPLQMYTLRTADSIGNPGDFMPKDFIVAGSNDGILWDLVDTRTGEMYSDMAVGSYKKFSLSAPSQSYTMFRLIISRVVTTNTVFQMTDIRFYPTLDVERDFYGSSSAIDAWIGTARGKVVQLYDQSLNGKHATQTNDNYQAYVEKQFGVYVARFIGTSVVPHFMGFADIYPTSFWSQYYINALNGTFATLFARAGTDYGFRHASQNMTTIYGNNEFLGFNTDTKPYWMINRQYGSNNQNPKTISLQTWNRVTGSRMTSTGPINQLGRGYTPLFRDFNGFLAELIFFSKPALVSDALLLDASPFPKTTTSTFLSQTLNTTIGRLGALVGRGFSTLLDAVQIMSSFASTSSGPRTGSGPLILNNQNFGNFQYMVKRGSVSIEAGYTPTDYFSSVKDTAAAIVVIDGNLTIGADCVFTPPTRKLFMVLYITGDLILDGEISMTARGANHNATPGESGFSSVFPAKDIRVYTGGEYGDLFGATDAFVPASGGNGGAGGVSGVGNQGTLATSGGSAGGGAGGGGAFIQQGGGGTSFSGGTGGGGYANSASVTYVGGPGEPNGGLGGVDGGVGGGAGNGPNGTGGTLFVIVSGTVSGNGKVTSHGSTGVGGIGGGGFYHISGGGSGGGSAWLLAGSGGDSIKVTATGGGRARDRSGLGGNGSAMKISLRTPSISLATRSSVIGAYSLRRLISSWGGPVVRIRHGTTNEQRDFYAEDLEAGAALDVFLGGAVAYIATWYDQSGSNRHATQGTTTSQPWIVRDASWTSQPTVRCGGVGFLNYTGTGLVNTNYTVAVSTARTSDVGNHYFLGGTGTSTNTNLTLGYRTNTVVTHVQYNVDYNMTVEAYVAPTAETFVARHSSTLGKNTFRNGSLLGSSGSLAPLTAYPGSAIGAYRGILYNGDISEVVLLASYVPDSERSLLETSMIASMTPQNVVYAPLDIISTAAKSTCAAAYSLRQVTTTYTGPVVRLRRPSDSLEQDFTASQFDSGAVATWAGAEAVTVVTLMDQSGGGNHLTQATVDAQPVIQISDRSIRFDTTLTKILAQTWNVFGTSPVLNMHMVAATREVVRGTNDFLSFTQTGASAFRVHTPWENGTWYFDIGPVSSAGAGRASGATSTLGSTSVFSGYKNPTNGLTGFRINGGTTYASTGSTSTMVATGIQLGGPSLVRNTVSSTHDFYEWLIFSARLPVPDEVALEINLQKFV